MRELAFEIDKIVMLAKKHDAKIILLQFPDGLKPRAQEIAKAIECKTKAKCFIWLESCYGACDVPTGLPRDIDLVFSFGHSLWPFKAKVKAMEI